MNNKLFSSVPITAKLQQRLHGIGYIIQSALFWAAMGLTGRFVPHNFKALQVAWVRYGSHLIFLLAAFGPRHRAELIRTHVLKLQLFRLASL